MRRFIFLFIACYVASFANAQVKNSNGEKVIRKIEVYNPDNEESCIEINFIYGGSNRLERIEYKSSLVGDIYITKNGSKISRIEYDSDGTFRRDLVYQYIIKDGLVIKCAINNIGRGKCVLSYAYFYNYDDKKRLESVGRRVFFHEWKQPFKELSDRYKEVFEWDDNGNAYTSGEIGYQWKIGQKSEYKIKYDNRKYYDDLINDTNINLPMLYENIRNNDRLEIVTEWFGKHPLYLIERDNGYYYDYSCDNENGGYDLSDSRGNIVQMDVYNCYKVLEKTFKIFYKK